MSVVRAGSNLATLLEKFPYFYGKILAAKFPDSFFFARKFTENWNLRKSSCKMYKIP